MAEATAKTIKELAPNLPGTQTRLVFIQGTTNATGDIFTVTDLTTVTGCYLAQATGALPTSISLSTNVITINNAGGALTYSGLVWGT